MTTLLLRRTRLVVLIGGTLALGLVGLSLCGCSRPSQPPAAGPPEQPAPEQPAPGQPAPEQPAPQQLAPQQPAPEQPAPEQPAPEQPAPEQPAPEQPGSTGAADPNAPPVSSFAPAADLTAQLAEYVEDLEQALGSESDYADFQAKVAQDASTLAVLALALGMHDEENPHRANAAAIIKAAQQLAAAGDYAAATQALAAVKEAVAEHTEVAGELKWEPVASLPHLMKAVPTINTNLKRYTSESRFASRAKQSAGFAAVLAAIAQASLADTSEAENDAQAEQWRQFCIQMRDAAGAVGSGIRAQDFSATQAAMERLAQSCHDCHEVFHPAALDAPDAGGM